MSGDKLTSKGLGKKPVREPADHIPESLASAQGTAIKRIQNRSRIMIYDKWTIEKQINAALGLLDAETTALIKADIQSVLDAGNLAKDNVLAITASDGNDISESDKQGIRDAANAVWPTI